MCHCHSVGHLIRRDNKAGALAAAPQGVWSVDSEKQKTCRSEKVSEEKNRSEVRAPRHWHVRRRCSFSGSEGNARVAAQRPLAAVALVFMDNSSVRLTFAAKTAKKKNSLRFPLEFVLELAATAAAMSSGSEGRAAKLGALLRCQLALLGEK